MAESATKTWTAPPPTFWQRTKAYSNTAYSKALKPGFDKTYAVIDKLAAPVNHLSNKVGSEAFWPTSIDRESEKCARILRTFCKDGFYEDIVAEDAQRAIDERRDTVVNNPQGVQRNVVKIPAKVIQNAVGLAVFTTMRTGWILGGSGGAGVVVARHPETREWSPPSGIMTQNFSVGFLAGVDIYDTVLVINNYQALEAFTRLRCTLGTELGVVAGPVGVGGELDMEIHKKPAPVWSYVKSRGLYAGIALAGNAVIERTDENAKFYGYEVSAKEILGGKVRHPPLREYQILMDTLKAAQGDQIDENLLPAGEAPSDFEIDFTKGSFGIPSAQDDDPYGVKALEAEGLHIREAGTHQRPSAELFEFNPAPSSPIYKSFRKSIDGASLKRRTDSWRDSSASLSSMTRVSETPIKRIPPPLPPRESISDAPKTASPEDSTSTIPQEIGTVENETSRSGSPSITAAHSSEATLTTKESDDADVDPIHDAAEHERDLLPQRTNTRETESDLSDIDSDAEIGTAVASVAKPTFIQVARPAPPALPARNPGRGSVISPVRTTDFTVKLKTNQEFPHDNLVLRTSIDNWTIDHRGQIKDGVWHFDLDTEIFDEDFECKFVVLPNRWMHDPNLIVESPTGGEDITFTDSKVVFDPPSEEEVKEMQGPAASIKSDADDDAFVSVPPTPDSTEPVKELRSAA